TPPTQPNPKETKGLTQTHPLSFEKKENTIRNVSEEDTMHYREGGEWCRDNAYADSKVPRGALIFINT
ncbi:unnamed protein product, partial [Sphenostylis stenocarpa]